MDAQEHAFFKFQIPNPKFQAVVTGELMVGIPSFDLNSILQSRADSLSSNKLRIKL